MPDNEAAELTKGLQKILDRSSTDAALKMISELLETLTMAIEKVGESSEQTSKTAQDTTDRITEAISKLSTLTKTPQVTVDVDLSAIASVNKSILTAIEQMNDNQKAIIQALNQQPQQADMKPLYAMIENTNKLINSICEKETPAQEAKEHPKSWHFEVERNEKGNRISKIVATAK